MAKSTPMTPEAASRIQSHADKTGTNQDFKARAQSAAEKNTTGSATDKEESNTGGNEGDGDQK